MKIIFPLLIVCASIQINDSTINTTKPKNKGLIVKGCKVGIMQISERKRKKIFENYSSPQMVSSSTSQLPARLKNDL